jgi:hypothetical protein
MPPKNVYACISWSILTLFKIEEFIFYLFISLRPLEPPNYKSQLHRIWLTIDASGQELFLPRHMGGGLVYGLMVISAFGSSYFLLLTVCILLCVMHRPGVFSRRCIISM